MQWTKEAERTYASLKANAARRTRYKAVKKTIELLSINPRHNSLQTHHFVSLQGPNREKIFESYAQQNTPEAYRVFWYYGLGRGIITVVAITPHP